MSKVPGSMVAVVVVLTVGWGLWLFFAKPQAASELT